VDGLTVLLTNQTKGPNTFSWSFGDGSGSTARNPTHTYAQPGTYTIRLTATNKAGGSASEGKAVTVGG
jgi:PKD repeat protein